MASPQFHFHKGMEVEVFSDEKDLRGALFVATVIRSVSRRNKVLIEYQTLVADERGTKPLREMVDVVYLRPIPPREKDRRFEVSDEVDAYHNDCWWEGVVIRVLENRRYLVYFRAGKEELEFEQSEMRIHREWVRGVWVPPMEEDMDMDMEVKPEVGVAHVQVMDMEQDIATVQIEGDVKTDQTHSSYGNDAADVVNGSNTRNQKIELPSCNIKISSPCKKLKKEVSERPLVREPVPRFDKERTGGVLDYDRSAGHPMLDDFNLSPVYNIEKHCQSSESRGQCSQNKLISQSCKKLKNDSETGSFFPPDKEMSTSATSSLLEELSDYPEPKEKSATALQYDRSGGHPMFNDFNLSPLSSFEEQAQHSQNSSVTKLKKGDETESSILTRHPAKEFVVVAPPGPLGELSAHLEMKEKSRSATDYDRSGGHPMLDFNLSPSYGIEVHHESSKSRFQYSQNNMIAQSCKKSKKEDESGSSFSMTRHLREMSMGTIRIGSDFDHDMSSSDPTIDVFGLSPLLDIEGEQSVSCTQAHCSQNNLIQY